MKILLPDGEQLDISIKPKLLASELLDIVASHLKLKEKGYFGLCFKDSVNKSHWLQPERQVLDHSFPKTASENFVISFSVRFYAENTLLLKDDVAIELFFLQARQSIYEGKIECESDRVFMLAAYVLQATYGDYVDDETAKENLKMLPVLPTETLREFPSLPYCEDRVLTVYRNLKGQTRKSSIQSYLSIVERLSMYGVHYTQVKDGSGLPWWIGISHEGISLYDFNDKKTPRRVFAWNQLESLYFRGRKFSVEIHDVKRSSSIFPRRIFSLSGANVLSWFTESAQSTKTLWKMAVAQHQLVTDCKRSKASSIRSPHGMSGDFSKLRSKKPLQGHRGRSWSASFPVPDNRNIVPLISPKVAERELFEALREKQVAIRKELEEKRKSLIHVCLQEAAITGHLPVDVSPEIVDLEAASRSTINNNIPSSAKQMEVMLEKLERDVKLQKRIMSAYESLAACTVGDKPLQKSRLQLHRRALEKLRNVESKLKFCQMMALKSELHNHDVFPVARTSATKLVSSASCSSPDLTKISSTEMIINPAPTSVKLRSHCSDLPAKRHTVVDPAISIDNSLPFNPVSHRHVIDSVSDMALYSLRTHQASSYLDTEDLDTALLLGGQSRCSMYHRQLRHSSLEGGLSTTGSLSGECRERCSESGLLLDRTSLSSILDITCEDGVDDDAFELPLETEEPETMLPADGRHGKGRCSRCVSCTRLPKSSRCYREGLTAARRQSRSTPSLRRPNSNGQNSKLPSHRQVDSAESVSDTVAAPGGAGVDSTGGHESHLYKKPTGRSRSKLSRSNSCSGRMARRRTSVANDLPLETAPRAGNPTPHRRSMSSLGRK